MTLLAATTSRAIESNETGLVGALATRVSELLADDRIARRTIGEGEPNSADEHDLARSAVRVELARLSGARRAEARAVLTATEELHLTDAVIAHVLGLGRLQPLLDDPNISDIHVRGCAPVWVKMRDGAREQRPSVVDTDGELIDLIRRAGTRMGSSERRFDAGNPELNLQLPDGSRLFATMDVSLRPSLVIRRHRFDISSLDELRRCGMFSETVHEFFAAAVRARRNIVIAGGTGSGKTTLLRALVNEIQPAERLVTIEDAYELGLDRFEELHPDHDALQSRPANIEGQGEITLTDLTRMALRMDPDRVIVGEVRGGEAFPMLLAMGQGNNGSMCTMHADSTRSVFPKLAAYVSMASTGLPIETINLLIASSVHFVVYIDNSQKIRRVASIREVIDSDGINVISNEVYQAGSDSVAAPAYPLREATQELFREHGFDAASHWRIPR
ncbi:MAG: ATPase, T2SS/T4P/T4SS family [Ilumatobacteraceae bacterium]